MLSEIERSCLEDILFTTDKESKEWLVRVLLGLQEDASLLPCLLCVSKDFDNLQSAAFQLPSPEQHAKRRVLNQAQNLTTVHHWSFLIHGLGVTSGDSWSMTGCYNVLS